MKYTKKNPPLKCYMNQSTWMKEALKNGQIVGVCWHDTGAGNPYVKRYVQPDDNASNKAELLKKIGVNANHNDWNHIATEKGVNAFIGTMADGSVSTVEVGPNTTHAWGVGGGTKGSVNGYKYVNGKAVWETPFYLQFEIADDSYQNKAYFDKCYKEAVEYTAYICKLYNLNPKGTVTFNGVKLPVIICHKESHDYQLGSGHADVMTWFNKFGKTMDNVREDVYKVLKNIDPDDGGDDATVYKKGDKGLGVYASKTLLSVCKSLELVLTSGVMGNNDTFTQDMEDTTKGMQKLIGLKETGEIEQNTLNKIMDMAKKTVNNLEKKLTDTEKQLKTANTENKAYKKKIDALQKKLDSIIPGDVNGDGSVDMKDVLALREMLIKK